MTEFSFYEILGIVAGAMTTTSFLPQAVKVYRSRSARDYSLAGWLLFVSGVALWLIYGVLVGSLAIIVTNVVTLLLAGFILLYKLRFG